MSSTKITEFSIWLMRVGWRVDVCETRLKLSLGIPIIFHQLLAHVLLFKSKSTVLPDVNWDPRSHNGAPVWIPPCVVIRAEPNDVHNSWLLSPMSEDRSPEYDHMYVFQWNNVSVSDYVDISKVQREFYPILGSRVIWPDVV